MTRIIALSSWSDGLRDVLVTCLSAIGFVRRFHRSQVNRHRGEYRRFGSVDHYTASMSLFAISTAM